MTRRVFTTVVVLLLAGCPEEETGPGPGPDPDPPTPPDLTELLGPDEARAGQLAEEDVGAFIGGTAASSEPGDYLLYNDRARFVVRGLRDGHFYAGYAGSVIDMDIVRPEGQADRDGMDDFMTMLGLAWLFRAESIEVLADGSDGGAAVVQAVGTDVTFEFFEGALEAPGLFPPRGLEVTQTFTLQPGVPVLEITTDVVNTTDDDQILPVIDAGMVDLATFTPFIPGTGFDGDPPDADRTMMSMASHRDDLNVATFRPDGDLVQGALSQISDEFELVAADGDTLELAPGEEGSYARLLGVARDQATLEAYRREVQGLAVAEVGGVVTEEGSGAAVAGARVFLTDTDGNPQAMAVTDDSGAYSFVFDPGSYQVVVVGDGNNELMDFPAAIGAYGVYAHDSVNELALRAFGDPGTAVASADADGYGRSGPVDVTLTEGSPAMADVELAAPALLELTVEDGDGNPLAAMVHVQFPDGVSDPQPADGRLGENRPRGNARKTVWVLDGEMTVPMVPGTYDLVGHRGFRYEMDRVEGVELASGETTQQTLVLEQAYDTPGWISGDLHAHASPSMDGECTVEERLATAACGDVQVHVSTDHDHVADYRPAAEAMGIAPWTITVPGDEISPTIRGHFNIYPVEPDADAQNGGAPRWWEHQVTTSELFVLWRERVGPDGVLQVNHGRGGSNGMFSMADFDPEYGEAYDTDFYCDAFDTMEILNSKGYGDAEELREDWRAHLDLGLRPTAVGVSDAHGRLPGSGHGRTYVRVGVDDLADLDTDDFFAALKAQKAIVSGGPFVTLTATDGQSDAEIGETLEAASATLELQVWAPSWMIVDEVRIYTSGGEVAFTDSTAETAPPLWYDGSFEVAPDGDTYYFAEVLGSGDMGPLWSGAHAYALTNPVYIDVP